MPSIDDRISEEAARAIWRRAAQLQAEAERRLEERTHQMPGQLPVQQAAESLESAGLRRDDVRIAAEEAGIAPEFVEIALAETAASPGPASPVTRWDVLGAQIFLGSSRHTIEVSAIIPGDLDTVSAAGLQVFSGHPCLLQTGEVAEIPSSSGRVIVFNVPKYDWGATANPPFVEKASMIGLRQLHVAIRPLPEDPSACEVVVAGDLRPGMRRRWQWGAATSVGASAAGGAWGVGLAGSVMAGALLALPALVGAAVVSGATVAAWAAGYRYYRSRVEDALRESLELLPATARAIAAHQGGRDPARRDLLSPQHGQLPPG
ncbi:MAG: putative serine/threonine protein kinase [Geminicoccaceae bacterium]|nr:putative serine/threonine protein kinase [Geminicoccaceae bacterium]